MTMADGKGDADRKDDGAEGSRALITVHPSVAATTVISGDAAWPRPWVMILGSVHGDEPCGSAAIEQLTADFASGELDAPSGTIFLIVGNPTARAARRRYTKDGVDLNRIFDLAFQRDGLPAEFSAEHRRALELRPLLEQSDAILDLHSASLTTPAFAAPTDAAGSLGLARKLGVSFAVFGWEEIGGAAGGAAVAVGRDRSCPGVLVECGQHDDPESVTTAYNVARRFLVALELVDGERHPPPTAGVCPEDVCTLRLVESVPKPSADFRFARPLSGFFRVEAGAPIGGDGSTTLAFAQEGYVILPNDAVPVGVELLFLAAEAGPADGGP